MTLTELFNIADFTNEKGMLFNKNCMDLIKDIGGGTIDLTLTDIPYDSVNRESNGLRNLDKGCADILTYDPDYVQPSDILEFNVVPNRKGKLHPTEKPVELLEWLVKTYSNENDIILDNCMGSGSTGIACINTNRNFIGIEKDEKYFQIAKERLDKSPIM